MTRRSHAGEAHQGSVSTARLGPRYTPIELAAERLGISPEALRARCRRASTNERGTIVARLGAGIVAVKLGTSWRVRFPEE